MQAERGFSLVEMLIVVAIIAMVLLGATALRGTQPPRAHVAALGLQAALVEARALAMSNAGVDGSGATLDVVPSGSGSLVSIYDSRPIAGQRAPAVDRGFPPQQYAATFAVSGGAPGSARSTPGPFAVFVSSSGYASVARGYVYDPKHPVALATDPGCDEAAGVTITVSDGAESETHPLDCRETQYEAASAPSPSASAS